MTTGGDDRLSALSDDLLRRILYFVPSKNAASTSVLSRRWGSLWRSSGAVNLAVKAFFSDQEAFVRGAKAALDATEAPITRLTLRVESNDHDGESTISQFLGRTRDWQWQWQTPSDVVGAVVSHQAACRVEELRVFDDDVSNDEEEENDRHAGVYGLASLPSSDTLRVLDLTGCHLAAMAVSPLPRLASLRLRYCSVEPSVVQALLDAAAAELTTVKLESLFFLLPTDSQHKTNGELDGAVLRLSFQAATTLVLALCGMQQQQEDSEDEDEWHDRSSWAIEIDAPRLQSFKYKGLMRRFILRSAAPGVARVDLHFLWHDLGPYHRNGGDYDNEKETRRMFFWQFLNNFTSARTLKLKIRNELKDIAAIGVARRARLLCVFPRVERLELEGVHGPKSKTVAVAIANLLHCCPVLGEIMLRLSTVTARLGKDPRYGREFLRRKDGSDYTNSMDRFGRRWKSKTTISMEDSNFGENKYDDVPGVPGLSGRSYACLRSTLRRVGLQFRLDSNAISSCLGQRLIKFFADHARVLEEIFVETGNRRLDEHLNFNAGTQMALAPKPISATASIQHKDLAESSSEFPRISIASPVSTTDKRTVGFTVLPLQRQETTDSKS